MNYKELKEKYLGNAKENQDGPIEDIEKTLHAPADIQPEEESAIHTYRGSDYSHINDYHRYGKFPTPLFPGDKARRVTLPDIERHTTHLDSLIGKHTTNHDIHTWRGIDHDAVKGLGLNDRNKGKVIHDKGYTSTTLKPEVAHFFANYHLVHIKVPKGSKAIAVNSIIGKNNHEHEVLLPRNSKFKYEGSKTNRDGDVIHHLTHIPEKS